MGFQQAHFRGIAYLLKVSWKYLCSLSAGAVCCLRKVNFSVVANTTKRGLSNLRSCQIQHLKACSYSQAEFERSRGPNENYEWRVTRAARVLSLLRTVQFVRLARLTWACVRQSGGGTSIAP